MPPEISVLVVDDHPLFRRGVVETLDAEPGITVVGEAATADDAVAVVRANPPDVVLLDLGIPGGGLSAARSIAGQCPSARIAILTASEDQDNVELALESGAKAYVVKGVSAGELVAIVKGVARGEAYVTPALAAAVLMERKGTPGGRSSADPIGDLTDREQEVLELVAEALSNKEIAARLSITEKTVKHHVTSILEKLQARNRVEAALRARGQKTIHDEW